MLLRRELDHFVLEGSAGALPVAPDDEITLKLAMLLEGQCEGLGPSRAARKYHYTRQRYFQLLRRFQQCGADGLKNQKRGPKTNYRRTDEVVRQVIRHLFLDPDASSEVIVQKIRQCGMPLSNRSVERILHEYGLQKKTIRRAS
jgi:transposase